MPWIILVLALAVVTSILIIAYGYRRALIVMSIIVGTGLGLLIWYGERGNREGSDFPADEVSLASFAVNKAYGDSYKLAGRIKNGAADHTLTRFSLTLTAKDCVTEGGDRNCVTVGESIREVYLVVPPGQARDFVENFHFGNMTPEGELAWTHRISKVRGE